MEQFGTRFKQVGVLPMVKHYMDELDLINLFIKYVPATAESLADHAESLCIWGYRGRSSDLRFTKPELFDI